MIARPLTVLRLLGAILIIAFCTIGVAETDIWGHIRFGLDLLAMRQLPLMDRYSFTSDQRWINHEWASQLIFAAAFKHGGLPMLAFVRLCVVIALAAVLARQLRRTAWPLRDGLLAGALVFATPLLKATRPQIFSLPLYALTLSALLEDRPWLPIVFLVWANVHGGWLIGLGAVVVRAVSAPSRKRIAILIGCVAATLINPYGISLWWSLLDAMRRGWADVSEWQPIYARPFAINFAIIWIVTAGVAIWAALRERKVDLFTGLWTACVAVAAIRVSRHAPFFVITATVLVAARVTGREPPSNERWSTGSVTAMTTLAAATAFAVWFVLKPTVTCLPPAAVPLPQDPAAVRYIRGAGLRGRVLVYFDWGLYAIWHLGDQLKVSIDNRRETVYSKKVVSDHSRFYDGYDPDYGRRLNADYVWLPPSLPPVRQLQQRGWATIYEGSRSVILSRAARPRTLGSDVGPSCFPMP